VPVAGAAPRVFAHVFLPPETPGGPDTNVSHKVLSAGWARVHDSGSRRNANATPEEEEEGGWKAVQRRVQDESQSAARGLWGPDDLLRVEYNMPTDGMAFLSEWKGKEIEAVVEQVRDGSMLRLRLFLSPRHHQLINLSLAGVKSPRVSGGGGPGSNEPSEPFAEEARFFVESRLMQRNVKVSLLSMPAPTSAPTPFGSNAPTPAPTAPSMLIGSVLHPVGDIATFLLGAGLARCVDWHAGMLQGGMEKYRQSERAAKEKRAGIWKNWEPANAGSNGAAGAGAASILASPEARTFDAVVTRIISGDTLQVRKTSPADSPELRIHLSSIRQPQAKDSAQAGYAHEAREFLRKRCIGKGVRVHIDWVKKPEGQFEERRYATVLTTTGSKETKGSSVGELLIQKGLATVTRHRRDDEDRSPEFDKLMAAEASAVAEKRGLHSGKPMDAPRLVDASESAGRANSFLLALKRGGKQAAVVDFVASASRFKLIVPRENARITFVLAGIRAPRTARNANEKDEPFGREGLEYTSSHALMRDCEIAVEGVDKVGGFIGALYLNRSENYAVTLVEQGLASVHGYSADNLSYGPQLCAAEKAAKEARKGMWADWSEEKEAAAGASADASAAAAAGPSSRTNGWGAPAAPVAARDEYVDVVVSDVRGDAGASGTVPFAFSVQILDDKIQGLESLQAELNRAVPSAAPAGFTPRSGDLLL
jgi:staphylococcal nuclease domain-containing protein 1